MWIGRRSHIGDRLRLRSDTALLPDGADHGAVFGVEFAPRGLLLFRHAGQQSGVGGIPVAQDPAEASGDCHEKLLLEKHGNIHRIEENATLSKKYVFFWKMGKYKRMHRK